MFIPAGEALVAFSSDEPSISTLWASCQPKWADSYVVPSAWYVMKDMTVPGTDVTLAVISNVPPFSKGNQRGPTR